MTIKDYLSSLHGALAQVDPRALEAYLERLWNAYEEGRRVFVFGNGACAALASHLACDLGKITAANLGAAAAAPAGRRLRIIALTDNVAWITALANDVAYEDVFVEQLKNLMEPDDLVLGLSGSGGSANVLRALEYAKAGGAVVVGFTGQQAKAQAMRPHCDLLVQAPSAMMEQIEDFHVIFHHAVVRALVARITDKAKSESMACASSVETA